MRSNAKRWKATSAFSKIVLRNLLVTGVSDSKDAAAGAGPSNWITLQLSDRQARRLFFVVKNGEWSLILRPFVRPAQSPDELTSINTILNGNG